MKRIIGIWLACTAAVMSTVAVAAETVSFAIDTVDITYWTDYSDVESEQCVYTLNFSAKNDFPQVILDATLPHPMELSEGTYSLAEGTLDAIVLFLNQEEYNNYFFGGDSHWFDAAEMTLTRGAQGRWTFAMRLTEGNTVYTFSFAQKPAIHAWPEDEQSQKDKPYADEQREPVSVFAALDSIIWKSETISKDGILDIILTQREADERGLRDYVHLGMYTDAAYPAAGVYPINGSEENGSFSASMGWYEPVIFPCYLAKTDAQGWVYTIFYIVSGEIRLSYIDGQPQISGECLTYFGSSVRFAYSPVTQGIDVPSDATHSAQKILRGGRIFIQRGKAEYNTVGTREK